MDDLAPLEAAARALVDRVGAASRKRLARQLAIALRRSQAARIGAQQNPDGSAFAPRKPQARTPVLTKKRRPARHKGEIKLKARRKAMFVKLKSAAFLRTNLADDAAEVGFFNPVVARLARVHQEGLSDRVNRGRETPRHTYPARRLLGFTPAEREMLAAAMLEHLQG